MNSESIIPNPMLEDLIHPLWSFHISVSVGLGEEQ